MKIKSIIKILLIISWMGLIFTFSSQNAKASLGLSDKIIIKVAEILKHEKLDAKEAKKITKKYAFLVRKSAHLFCYFILGLFIYLFLKDFLKLKESLVFITIFCCFLYAITDEVHQIFSSGRTAQFLDVIIDTFGSTIAVVMMTIYYHLKAKYIKK